jgi:uncharacterized protein YndB with AHSA1/START domain
MSKESAASAVADLEAGTVLAAVEIAVPPERVFRALTSDEIVKWWGSDDLYRTTAWKADLRVGGTWRADGRGSDGSPFYVEGEFVEIDPPRKLVQTWKPGWESGPATTISYLLDPTATGTRVTVRHTGFIGRAESCAGHANGWTRVLGWLLGHLRAAPKPDERRFYFIRLLPPRPSFALDMNEEERAVMQEHVGYWTKKLAEGTAIVFGPVLDPTGPWGLGVVRVNDEAELKAFEAEDPAIRSRRGLRYEVLPMIQAVVAS